MRKLILGTFLFCLLAACSNQEAKTTEKNVTVTKTSETSVIEHIFKPTYTDNIKVGDQKNVLLVEQFHEAVFAKDYSKVESFLADTAVFNNEDGTTLKGKAALIDFMKKNYAPYTFKNYKVGVTFPVVGDNGHQWVIMYDEADVVAPDGKSQNFQWVDAYRFEGGKIVGFNGFGKTPKK
jgi:ketosteroid isomerase-like protein